MAIAIRGKTAFVNASASSVSTGAWSTAPQSGDIVIIFVYTAGTTVATTPTSTGFTAATSGGPFGSGNQMLAALTKTAGASEPASYSVACAGGTTFIAVQAICVSGASAVDVAAVLQGATAAGTTETISMPSLTTTTANDEYIGWAFYNQNVSSITSPTGLTVYDPSDIVTGWGQIIGHTTEATAGTYGSATSYHTTFNGLTSGVGWGGSVAVALKPTTGTAFSQTLAATQSQTASLTKIANKKQAVTTTQSQTASLTKGKTQNLSTTQSQTASLAKVANKRQALTAAQSQTASLAKQKTQNLTTTQSQTTNLTKQKTQNLAATQAQSATLAVGRVFHVNLTATQPQTATMTKRTTSVVSLKGSSASTGKLSGFVTWHAYLKGSSTSTGKLIVGERIVISLKGSSASTGKLYIVRGTPIYLRGSSVSSGLFVPKVSPLVIPLLSPETQIMLRLVNRDCSLICELPFATVSEVVWALDDVGQMTYQVDREDVRAPLIKSVGTEAQLWYRGVPIWMGPNWRRQASPKRSKGGSPYTQWTCENPLSYFKHRFVLHATLTYTSMDQTAIFSNIISAVTTGDPYMDLSLPVSAPASGVIRSRNYPREQHQRILDVLQQFGSTKLNRGFDFDVAIDPSGAYRSVTTYFPQKGSQLNTIAFYYPGNILDYTYNEDGTQIANWIYATGGTSSGIKMENNYEDTGSASANGVMEDVISDGQELDVAWLLDDAKANVNIRKNAPVSFTITVPEANGSVIGKCWPGDVVYVNINDNDIQYAGYARIAKLDWKPQPPDQSVTISFVPPVVLL